MISSVSHYVQRSRELGPLGTFRRAWMRSVDRLSMWIQSVWWGWIADREMSDAGLLVKTKGSWRSVDSLLVHLANRPASSFLFPHESQQETKQFLYENYPDYVLAVISTADDICEHRLSLLGQVFQYSDSIDWHKEPITGWQWPLWHRNRIGDYLDSPDRPVDLIFFWEMNRHQYFITLGIAYWLTGDEKYTDAFCSQILSWIRTNPVQHGLNWYYPLEISMRIMAWTAAFQFFRHSQLFREKAGGPFLKSLWQQVNFVSKHLQSSREDVPNNHMMAELTGLTLVSASFPEFRNAQSWRDEGLRLLSEQASAQTHMDGVNKEQATGYHRFIAELILLVVSRSRLGDFSCKPGLESTLEHMLDYMLFTLTPSKASPMWGDSDYGRALGLGKNKDFWDFRPILSAGAALFNRLDFKFAAGRFDEEAFWLLGRNGLNAWNQIGDSQPASASKAFPYAGIYVIRDTWNSCTDFAVFRCGPFGLGGEEHCAHAHCDLMSLVLWVHGEALLVDSGSYIYHGPLRDHFRLSAAHNTVMIDSREQAIPMVYFNWTQISEANCLDWTGKHVSGRMIHPSLVEFTREIDHPKQGNWEVIDKFTGDDKHTLEWFFHFAPGLQLKLNRKERTLYVLMDGKPFVKAIIPQDRISYLIRESWYSDQYAVKRSNQELYAKWTGVLGDKGKIFQWRFQFIDDVSITKGGIVAETRRT